jgi:hypothetical protein
MRRMTAPDEPSVEDEDDLGKEEDFEFPWKEGRWSCNILLELAQSHGENVPRILPVVLPYIDSANSYNADAIVAPILRMVFGDRKVPADGPADLTAAQAEVLQHIFDNPLLWALEIHNILGVFARFGLPEHRGEWAVLLGIQEKPLSEHEIKTLIKRLALEQNRWERGQVKRLTLGEFGTRAFLPHLADFPDLEGLNLSLIPITDHDLARLLLFPKLQRLDIPRAQITDKGAEILAQLTNLADLNIGGTGITDAGLAALSGLKNLRNLYLFGLALSIEAVNAFKKAAPNCRVYQ